MGISLDAYRASIGLFNATVFKSAVAPCQLEFSLLLQCLPLAVIYILLLTAGIEPNPGPVCSICKLCLDSVPNYYRHVSAHSFQKNLKVRCYFDDCDQCFSSLGSLQSHVSRFHRQKKKVVQHFTCVCPLAKCSMPLHSRSMYLSHMRNHLQNGETFHCPFPNCVTQIRSKNQLGTHMSRYHPGDDIPVLQVSNEPTSNIASSIDVMEVDELENVDEIINDPTVPLEDFSDFSEDLFPAFVVKDEMARFYLKLEAKFLLPTSTVQAISEELKLLNELSHHCLKRALHQELKDVGVTDPMASTVIKRTFKKDPIYNVHHKGEDIEQLGSVHLREQYWKKHFNFVEPVEIYLGKNESGAKRYAHYVSIEESLKVILKDNEVKKLVQQSFVERNESENVLSDFTDGSAYKSHQCTHTNRKCLQILLFQDGFEFNPFGPAKGVFKPNGFYFTLGNLPPEHRSREDMIHLVYMILEKDLKPSQAEDLEDVDKLKIGLQPLLDELLHLKTKGVEICGEIIPVCLLFCLGDNLGQHFLGRFVQSFAAEFFCRFCPVSKTQFLTNPSECLPLRTPTEYDDYVAKARQLWLSKKSKAIRDERKRRIKAAKKADQLLSRTRAPGTRIAVKRLVSKGAYLKLCSINYRGVKNRPSPLNSKALDFHVCSPAMPPCLAHDLFEGVVKVIVAKVLKYFITVKNWFDLPTLNRRIKNFKCKGSDTGDAPTQLKNLNELSGNASENWNLLRLLPFIVGDLILDKDDEMWLLFLQLKEICELVCAPKITKEQVAYLQFITKSYLNNIKKLEKYLPSCLFPKQHLINHYSSCILLFGPLIRLFTLRYESKHTFFKKVARACKNYINITYTLARKYMYRFAYDHSSEVLPHAVSYDSNKSSRFHPGLILQEDKLAVFPTEFLFDDYVSVEDVKIHGIQYKKGYYMVLSNMGAVDLLVGSIDMILVSSSSNLVLFVFEERTAENTFNGYYSIPNSACDSKKVYSLRKFESLVDYYPLPSYSYDGNECLTLKHSVTCMI